MEKIIKNESKIVFLTDMNFTLANALRRSTSEIPTLAIDEVDIYKNDSALYDEVLAHRMALVPIKNQKVKDGEFVQMKLNAKASGKQMEVLSGEFGENSVYSNIPLVILDKDQELEVVAKARQGKAIEHSKFAPGLVYYRLLNKIQIGKEAEKKQELSVLYPEAFSFDNGKLKVKNEWAFDLEVDDLKDFEGITLTPTEEIVYSIESWGQMDAEDIFNEAVKALNKNLDEVTKALK